MRFKLLEVFPVEFQQTCKWFMGQIEKSIYDGLGITEAVICQLPIMVVQV
jgi:hypothetical protein